MGSLFSSLFCSSDKNPEGVPVVVNVYDLTPLNNYVYWCGLGIFHTGIEVHGLEYGFGAHDFPTSGVFDVEPRSCPGFVYRCSIVVGHINMPPHEVRALVETMAAEYHGDTYHLIAKNCNHFTDDVALRLTGKTLPGWINRLARLGAVCNCLLPDFLKLPEVNKPMTAESVHESSPFVPSLEPVESDGADSEERYLLSSSACEVTVVKDVNIQKFKPPYASV